MHGHAASAGVDSGSTTAGMGASGTSGAGVSHSPTLGADSEVDVASTATTKRRKRPRNVAQEEEHFDEEESTGDAQAIQSEPKRRKRGGRYLCDFPCEPPCEKSTLSRGKCFREA